MLRAYQEIPRYGILRSTADIVSISIVPLTLCYSTSTSYVRRDQIFILVNGEVSSLPSELEDVADLFRGPKKKDTKPKFLQPDKDKVQSHPMGNPFIHSSGKIIQRVRRIVDKTVSTVTFEWSDGKV